MERNLHFLPKFNAFGIADAELSESKQIPIIRLSSACYEKLGIKPVENALKIGFPLEKKKRYSIIGYRHVYAMVKSGMEPVGLDCQNCTEQLAGCSGLILPGGSFGLPEWYYTDGLADATYPNAWSQTYAYALYTALYMGIPILGICEGAQVIAAEFGSRLVKGSKCCLGHKTVEPRAHWVTIKNGSPLHGLLDVFTMMTNSHHKAIVADVPVLDCYAIAQDGVMEAWGSEKDQVLGIQWNPEDYVVAGNALHQKVYEWLANKAREYRAKIH